MRQRRLSMETFRSPYWNFFRPKANNQLHDYSHKKTNKCFRFDFFWNNFFNHLVLHSMLDFQWKNQEKWFHLEHQIYYLCYSKLNQYEQFDSMVLNCSSWSWNESWMNLSWVFVVFLIVWMMLKSFDDSIIRLGILKNAEFYLEAIVVYLNVHGWH